MRAAARLHRRRFQAVKRYAFVREGPDEANGARVMARPKIKLDLAAIKSGLFNHGEKIAFGCVVLVFLLFVWGAMSRETLDASKQPDNLRQKTQAVKSHVEQSQWKANEAGV